MKKKLNDLYSCITSYVVAVKTHANDKTLKEIIIGSAFISFWMTVSLMMSSIVMAMAFKIIAPAILLFVTSWIILIVLLVW